MLSSDENNTLTKVGPGTDMGDFLRRFWFPFLESSDLPERDGEPVRLTLLGEELLGFRDENGKAGLIGRRCPHRLADLFFGRNEQGGIRCTYHGWKFDLDGRCVDMPTEDDMSSYKDKVHLSAYPVMEKGGTLWAYMGPKELRSEFPDFEFFRVPSSHQYVSWSRQECSYAQAVEGGIDSAHSNYLHTTLDAYYQTDVWKEQGNRSGNLRDKYHARDPHPKFFASDMDYGIMIGARRETGEDQYYWRINHFLMPFYTMPPSTPKQKFFHAFVPIDDQNCARFTFVWNTESPISNAEKIYWDHGNHLHPEVFPGPDHLPTRNKANDYLLDRREQKSHSFTGLKGIGIQDASVQEGMGKIVDRAIEHLGSTDVGIIEMRKKLLREARSLREGQEPHSAGHGNVYSIRAGDLLLNMDTRWDDNEKTHSVIAPGW
jgi:phthalate 4,5-dioxygenase oxygenase subunit